MSEKEGAISLEELVKQYAMSSKDDDIFTREDFIHTLTKVVPQPESPPTQPDQDVGEEKDKGEKKED